MSGKNPQFDRRRFIAALSATTAAGLAGCTGDDDDGDTDDTDTDDGTADEEFRPITATEIPPDGVEGSVNAWHIYNEWVNAIAPGFEDEYGVSVNTAFQIGPEPVRAELSQGSDDIDVTFGIPSLVAQGIAEDWFEPLPVDLIEGYQANNKEIQDLDQEHFTNEDGELLAMSRARDWAPALVYNTDHFDSPPDSWGIFWEEDLAGEIALSELFIYPCRIAALYTGQDPTDPDDFEEIKEVLVQQRDLNQTYWGDFSLGQSMMSNEQIVATANTPGRAAQSQFEDDAPVNWTIPEEGSVRDVGQLMIPKGAPNPRAAVAWLDWCMKPENSVGLAAEHFTLPTNENWEEFVDEGEISQEQIDYISDENKVPPDAPEFSNIEESLETVQQYGELWTRVLGA
jgi:spermidine/putrescine transport system substrate-binding protein